MAWEALGAVIGAGFASGQEIAVFFAGFGRWSLLAVAAALIAVRLMTARILSMGEAVFHRPVWQAAFVLLAVVSGGAMTAAAGEIAALILPLHGARLWGMAASMVFALVCSKRNTPLLKWLCQFMSAVMLFLLARCLTLSPQRAAVAQPVRPAGAAAFVSVLYGVSWAGFNLALAAPMLAQRSISHSPLEKRRCAWLLTIALGAMLALGNAALLRHPLEMRGALPLVRLTSRMGYGGYLLCCAALLLAEVSTLAASLRSLRELLPSRKQWAAVAAMAAAALAGFGPMVSQLYPVLGALCTVLLLLPKEKALHAAQDVL